MKALTKTIYSMILLILLGANGAIALSSERSTEELNLEDRKIQVVELKNILKEVRVKKTSQKKIVSDFLAGESLTIQGKDINWKQLKTYYRALSDFHVYRVTRDHLSVQMSTGKELRYFITHSKVRQKAAQALLSFTRSRQTMGSSEVEAYLPLDFYVLPGVKTAIEANLKRSDTTSAWGIRPENENALALSKLRRNNANTWTIDKATAFNVLTSFRHDTDWIDSHAHKAIFKIVENWNPEFQIRDHSRFADLAPGGFISPSYLATRMLDE